MSAKPEPPRRPTRLVASRSQVAGYLKATIQNGKALVAKTQKVITVSEVEPDADNWFKYNHLLLNTVFDTTEFVDEYVRSHTHKSGGSALTGAPMPLGTFWGAINLIPLRQSLRSQIRVLESIAQRLPLIAEAKTEAAKPSQPKQMGSNRVFMVHGRDHAAVAMVEAFLRKLKLELVILSDQPGKSRTIIEKFEDYSDVSFAIVLLTPDDIGYPKDAENQMEARARQNVYLELGFFIGRLGRDRVIALYKKPVVIPSDYVGVEYVSMDDADWRNRLAKELMAARVPFELDNLLS